MSIDNMNFRKNHRYSRNHSIILYATIFTIILGEIFINIRKILNPFHLIDKPTGLSFLSNGDPKYNPESLY